MGRGSENCLWLAGGMLLLWVLNLGRLILVFWAGKQYGEHFAINVLHPFIGLVLFVLGIGVMILCIRPFGLRIGYEGKVWGAASAEPAVAQQVRANGHKHNLAVPRVYLALALVLVLGIIVGFSNVGLQSYNLVADVSGTPKLASYITDPVTPVGWTSRYEATFKWAAPLFGERSDLEPLRALSGRRGRSAGSDRCRRGCHRYARSSGVCCLRYRAVLPVPRVLAGQCAQTSVCPGASPARRWPTPPSNTAAGRSCTGSFP